MGVNKKIRRGKAFLGCSGRHHMSRFAGSVPSFTVYAWDIQDPSPSGAFINITASTAGGILRHAAGKQIVLSRLFQELVDESLCHLRVQLRVPILAVHRRIPDRIVELQAQKTPKQEVVVQLLHQQLLAAESIEDVQQQGAQELVGRDRGSPHRRVKCAELRRKSH